MPWKPLSHRDINHHLSRVRRAGRETMPLDACRYLYTCAACNAPSGRYPETAASSARTATRPALPNNGMSRATANDANYGFSVSGPGDSTMSPMPRAASVILAS